MDHRETYKKLTDEVFHERRLEAIGRFMHPEYRGSDPALPRGTGIDGSQKALEMILESFSDIHYEVLRQFESGEWLATHFRFTGTNRAPFLGMTSPGTRVSAEGISLNRFREGKIIEGHIVWDMQGMARQLGTR